MRTRTMLRGAFVAALLAVGGTAMAAPAAPPATSSGATVVTTGTRYGRNPSAVQDGATTYLFSTRTQANPCDRLAGCPADNTLYDLVYQTSSDGGASFGAPVLLATNSAFGTSAFNNPSYGRTVAATRTANGDINVFWASGGDTSTLVWMVKPAASSSFSAPAVVADEYFNVEAFASGNTVLVYQEGAQANAPGTYGIFARTFDNGTFTSGPTLVALDRFIPKVTRDNAGVFRMTSVDGGGNDYVASSADGITWSAPAAVVTAGGPVTNWDPSLIQTPDGLYHLYFAPDFGNGTQRIATRTAPTVEGLSAAPTVFVTQTTADGGYWDYWPEPFFNAGTLRLFFTSEAPTAATPAPGTGHVWQLATTVKPTKDQCKNGGYVAFGYPNQGQCVSASNR